MEKVYNKLVRDKIPEIIQANGEVPVTKIMDDISYKKALEDKLYEEYQEVISAVGEEKIEELADMIEVIRALALVEGKDFKDVITLADIKAEKRGAFKNKVYLEKVIQSD